MNKNAGHSRTPWASIEWIVGSAALAAVLAHILQSLLFESTSNAITAGAAGAVAAVTASGLKKKD